MIGKIKILVLTAAVLSGSGLAAVLWEENFNSYPDGTTAGASGKWTVDTSACSFDGDDHFEVRNGQMQGNDLDGEAVWTSEPISISGQGTVSVSASISDGPGGLESSDFIRLYYKLDGGVETLFETNGDNSGNFGEKTATQSGLNGSSLQLIIRMINGANTEFISFDDIRVESGAPATNIPPELDPIGSQSVNAGQTLSFSISATDDNNDPLSFSATNLPAGATFITDTFLWAPAGPEGVYTSRFTVSDLTTNDFEDVVITVLPPASNLPPVLAGIGDKEVDESDPLSFTVTASDPVDNDPITITATNLPTGAVFSNNTFIWNNAAPPGIYSVTFTATDKDGSDSETVTITVVEKPLLLLSEIADPAGTGGGDFRFVEIYNAGNSTVDLAGGSWFLSKQVNGGSWADIALTGTVAAARTYVAAFDETLFEAAYGFPPDQADSDISGTGNDAYFLYIGGEHTTGTLVDIYGEIDTDGTDTAWEYTDGRAERNKEVLEPNTVWTAAEWTVTPGATTNDMTPGLHGPIPEFRGLENPFVFLGTDLNLTVIATNPIRSDVINLSALEIPDGASFASAKGTNSVSSILFWQAPTTGVYTVTLAAEGFAGTAVQSITLTVAGTAEIDGNFYGWGNDTIVKLDNGQYWRNTGAGGSAISPPLRDPQVSVTKFFGSLRMFVETVADYQTVERIDIIESRVDSAFSGLRNGQIYELRDGTVWKQISFENISSSASPVTAWRWTENGKTNLRFLDRDDALIGTCEVIASAPPVSGAVVTKIDGYFRGWQKNRVFALANGEFWQQTTSKSSVDTLYRPSVTLTNFLNSGTWRLYVDGASAPGYVEVRQLTGVIRSQIDGWFYGFRNKAFFHLQNGSWWRQTSIETSASIRSAPEVLLWSDSGITTLEMPDEGRSVTAEQLTVLGESFVTNTFTGLRYANRYELASGESWLQISFENVHADLTEPDVMLWNESGDIRLLARGANDETIGDCTVVDPDADADGDRIANAAELIAGTAPDNANDRFLITDIRYDADGRTVLHWIAVEGRVYSVEWTPSLANDFQPLETDASPPWTDRRDGPETGGFYRIRVRLAE